MFSEMYNMVIIDDKLKIITAYSDDSHIPQMFDNMVCLKDVWCVIDGMGILSLNAKKRLARQYYYDFLDCQYEEITNMCKLSVPYSDPIKVNCDELDIFNSVRLGGNWWWWFWNIGLSRKPKGKGSHYVEYYRGWQGKYVDMPIEIKYHGWELRIV